MIASARHRLRASLRRPARIAWRRLARHWISPGRLACPHRAPIVPSASTRGSFPTGTQSIVAPCISESSPHSATGIRARASQQRSRPDAPQSGRNSRCSRIDVDPLTGRIQAQGPSLPGLDSGHGCCPGPRLHHGDLTGSAWLYSPGFNPSGPIIPFGGQKVLQVFVSGGSARETNPQIFA
jgi:hypothetical protein